MRPMLILVECALLLLGKRRRYRVTGRSMLPTLKHGDHAIIRPTQRPERLVAGETLVAIRHPTERSLTIIKRVAEIRGESLWVLSDNPAEGTDSRHFGWLSCKQLVGEVRLYF